MRNALGMYIPNSFKDLLCNRPEHTHLKWLITQGQVIQITLRKLFHHDVSHQTIRTIFLFERAIPEIERSDYVRMIQALQGQNFLLLEQNQFHVGSLEHLYGPFVSFRVYYLVDLRLATGTKLAYHRVLSVNSCLRKLLFFG